MTGIQYIHFAAELWGVLFSLMAAMCAFMTRYFDKKGGIKLCRLMLYAALLMASDAMAWLFRGNVSTAGFYIVRIANFSAFIAGFLMLPLSAEYISHIICKRSGIPGLYWPNIEWGFFSITATCLTINFFYPFIYDFDDRNTYYRLALGFLPGLLTILGLVISVGVVVTYFKYMNNIEKVALLSYFLLPIICTVIQIFVYGVSFTYLAVVVASFILFLSFEYNFMQYNINREKRIADEKIRLMGYQIRPHFIFNTLSVIRYLCTKDPEEAAQTINEFSGYLRGSANLLNEKDCITFDDEFDIVKHYINIEQKRFGKSISVSYDIQDTDYLLPPFTLQTAVENAIKHGLLENGVPDGKISIRTFKRGGKHVIEVEDNGNGFDTSTLFDENDKSHIGIANSKERIEMLSKGEMKIDSEVGKGTKVTILIPER